MMQLLPTHEPDAASLEEAREKAVSGWKLRIAHVYTNYSAFSHPYLRALGLELEKNGVELSCYSRLEPRGGGRGCTELRLGGEGRQLGRDLQTGCANALRMFRTLASRAGDEPGTLRSRIRQWVDLLPLMESRWHAVHLMNWPLYRLLRPYLRSSGAKFILSFRGYETLYGVQENEHWRQDVSRVFDEATALHFVSEFLAAKAIAQGAPRGKVLVIPPGVDVEYFHPRVRQHEERICQIATVCRLTWEKGLEAGLLAAHALRSRGVPVLYHVIGAGPSETALRCWAERLRLGDAVRWHGAKGSDGVREVLSDCDVYLQPSVSESFGVAIVEAMAMGIPVVATRTEGIPEIVRDGVTGYLLEFGDIPGVAAAIERIWMDRQLRLALGTEARNDAVKRFSIRREAREWREAYSSL